MAVTPWMDGVISFFSVNIDSNKPPLKKEVFFVHKVVQCYNM